MSSYAKFLEKEIEMFNEKASEINRIFEEMNQKFMEWKESVLKFEHFESSINDNSCDDDRICDGECIWTAEDEINSEQPVESPNGELENGSRCIDEERGWKE